VKKNSLFLIILFTPYLLLSVFAKNWKVYTNTNHIFDIEQTDEKYYIATWGGVLVYDKIDNNLETTMTVVDGLCDNEIRALDFIEENSTLLVGSKNEGISRLYGNILLMSINETTGLSSNAVNEIIHKDSLIYIATQNGISVFIDKPEFPFPVLLNNYTINSGLSSNDITSINLTEDDYLICGSIYGLDFVHIDSLNVLNAWNNVNVDNSLLLSNKITSISVKDEHIAIGTENGVIQTTDFFNFQQWQIYETDQSIFPVFIDNEYALWFSYGFWNEDKLDIIDDSDIAVKKITESTIESWDKDDLGLNSTKIMGFSNIGEKLCIYTWGEGFLFFDSLEWSPKIETNCIIANVVKDVIIDKNDIVWVTNGHKGHLATSKGTKGVGSFNGTHWTNYTAEDSPLRNNNIYSICVDHQNRKWFGAWGSNIEHGWLNGISVFDDFNNTWESITSSDGLGNNTISFITMDSTNRMWICSYGGSTGYISILNENWDLVTDFEMYEAYVSPDGDKDMDPVYIFFGNDKIYFGGLLSGLRIWNDTSDPITDDPLWSKTPFNDLDYVQIFDIKSREIWNHKEIWIASSAGLFMFDGDYWYKYGTVIKKKYYDNNSWDYIDNDPEYLYIGGENPQEKLYGAAYTYPTALFVDPFNRIWIGTQDNGITLYQPEAYYLDEFTNITKEKYPLLSNTITSFAYEPVTGTLYVGTDEGLNSFEIGIAPQENKEIKLRNVIVYPNPFYPEYDEILRIENISSLTMPKGDTFCNIYDLNGDFVIELQKNYFQQFSWDGLNKFGYKCSSGIYFYVVHTNDGQIARGKFALIR